MISSGDFKFRLDTGWERPSAGSGETYLVRKTEDMLQVYDTIVGPVMNGGGVAEIGILHGGAAAYMHHRFRPRRLWAIDLEESAGADLERYLERTGASNVSIHRGVAQDDETALRQAIGAGPLNVVLDDASHFLDETRATFEILFPMLQPGGLYVIEDWQWAHADYKGGVPWPNRPALTNLIFELAVAMGSAGMPEIARMELIGCMALLWKAASAPARSDRMDLRSRMRLGPRRLPQI